MELRNETQRGQALLMVSLSSFAIFGILGLAVDLGWSYFVKKSAQAAADAAALAAVRSALNSGVPLTCGDVIACTPSGAPVSCELLAVGSLHTGCLYAQQNGFTAGGENGRQDVQLAGGTSSPFNTATGPVNIHYWVTARVTQRIPQLFSAILGNTMGVSSAQATAGIVDTVVDGSLILLNRANDRAIFGNINYYGNDLWVQANDNGGMDALQTSGGILLSSNCNGSSTGQGNCVVGNGPTWAGVNQGGGTIMAPSTAIKTGGGVNIGGSGVWTAPPVNNPGPYNDPLSGKGQPPISNAGLPDYPVAGCVLSGGTENNPVILHPASYYSIPGQGGSCRLGDPIAFSGYFKFTATSTDPGTICSGGSCFGTYVFYGGVKGGSSTNDITFDPGRYVFAGAKPINNNSPGIVLDTSTNFTLHDETASKGRNTDAGEILVLTDLNYPGLVTPLALAHVQSELQMGTTKLQSGNNNSTYINLHGLNRDSQLVQQAGLDRFAPAVVWQDQANSSIKYDSRGNIVTSCAGGSMDTPCKNTTLVDPNSPGMTIQASPQINLYGLIYQPRGGFATMQGGGGYAGPLMMVTGAFYVQGNARLDLQGLSNPLVVQTANLIE